jgi:hypothetical protein
MRRECFHPGTLSQPRLGNDGLVPRKSPKNLEKTPLFQALQVEINASKQDADRKQLRLFDL